jgi:hypothetical protein
MDRWDDIRALAEVREFPRLLEPGGFEELVEDGFALAVGDAAADHVEFDVLAFEG